MARALTFTFSIAQVPPQTSFETLDALIRRSGGVLVVSGWAAEEGPYAVALNCDPDTLTFLAALATRLPIFPN